MSGGKRVLVIPFDGPLTLQQAEQVKQVFLDQLPSHVVIPVGGMRGNAVEIDPGDTPDQPA